jgi:CRP-like cAMP-binding protein/bacterioferritin-associated ferredoxin
MIIPNDHTKLLKSCPLLSKLSNTELLKLLEHAHTVTYTPDQTVFSEGDKGDCLYIILSGKIQISTQSPNGQILILSQLTAGQFFGEQSYLEAHHHTRNASAISKDHSALLVISYEILDSIIQDSKKIVHDIAVLGKSQKLSRELQQLNIFTKLFNQNNFPTSKHIRHYKPFDLVFSEGAVNDGLYLILEGEALVFKTVNNIPVKISYLYPGSYFGEINIFNDLPRTASIIAKTKLSTLFIDKPQVRALCEQYPEFKNFLNWSIKLYQRPGQGLMTQKIIKNNLGHDAFQTLYNLPNDLNILIQLDTVNQDYTLQSLDIKNHPITGHQKYFFKNSQQKIIRELQVNHSGALTTILANTEWPELFQLQEKALTQASLTTAQLQSFEKTGSCHLEQKNIKSPSLDLIDPIICQCLNIKKSTIQTAIDSGFKTFEQLQRNTGCATICGTCQSDLLKMIPSI